MCSAWGKPHGTIACVNISQILLSICSRDVNVPVIQEALRHARYKSPGRQNIMISQRWGITMVNKEDYLKLKLEKKVMQ